MAKDLATTPDATVKAAIYEAIRKLTEGARPDYPASHGANGAAARTSDPGPAN